MHHSMSVAQTVQLYVLVWACIVSMYLIPTDSRLWVSSVAYFAAFAVLLNHTELRWHVMSAVNFVLTVNLARRLVVPA